MPRVELRHFQYVLVHLREADPDEVPKLFAEVVEIFLSHRAMLDAMPSLLIGYIGVPNAKYDYTEARTNLVAALLAENGSAVRVADGQCNGLVGSFGGPRRWFYTGIVPNFSAVLKKLLDFEFGTAVEIP